MLSFASKALSTSCSIIAHPLALKLPTSLFGDSLVKKWRHHLNYLSRLIIFGSELFSPYSEFKLADFKTGLVLYESRGKVAALSIVLSCFIFWSVTDLPCLVACTSLFLVISSEVGKGNRIWCCRVVCNRNLICVVCCCPFGRSLSHVLHCEKTRRVFRKGNLRTQGKCRKHEPQANVFYISQVFSNDWSVLSQCNTRLKLLHLFYDKDFTRAKQ